MARPALAALAEQQRLIDGLKRTIAAQQSQIQNQANSIGHLGRGLEALAALAGVEGQVKAAMLKRADVQNPAQPIPEPPAVPPTQTTTEVKTPEAFADVQAPGLVPGSTNDVAADAVSTVYTPGQDIPGPAFKNLIDVTAPVEGTQGPLPLNQVRTETDVRVGDPMKPDVAFPLRGPFQNAQRTSAKTAEAERSNRTMASLRLAKLYIEAGMAETNDEFVEATKIEKDASRTTEVIEHEIRTLDSVRKAASQQRVAANRRAVPRPVGQQVRSTPSMQSVASIQTASSLTDDEAESLFD